ncbi:piggyBac transposable element-derived protein 4-like isoform X2 [Hyposmocoma kahamanoa]|uniref:piggyBac transposable element-derived protein 4-like isoform X2 n=1 Tax=Hyposmocoma kahamanoa TaxID=1477025 RepID=UPI000E6DA226|nr:piggyBac transposable element-derived protein 4-like isoform X2 [Hyposmocoma kahamanoa]
MSTPSPVVRKSERKRSRPRIVRPPKRLARVPKQEQPVEEEQRPLSPFVIFLPSDGNPMKGHKSDSELDESEGEIESQVNASRRDICPSPTLLPINMIPTVAADLQRADSGDDKALRGIASPEFLNFDWRKEPEIFRGVREVFTGTPGPTCSISLIDTPFKAFLSIWDPPIIDLIVRETNQYAQQILDKEKFCFKTYSRYKTWTPTDANEMLTFFAILIFHSLSTRPVEQDYFKTTGTLAMPGLASLMSSNRFFLIKRFLHFTDLTNEPSDMTPQQRTLYKIQPIVDSLRQKFSSLYMPSQSIAVAESLLVSGRLSFAQKISNKAGKGIKSFELCESSTGYLWECFVYAGKQAANRQTG